MANENDLEDLRNSILYAQSCSSSLREHDETKELAHKLSEDIQDMYGIYKQLENMVEKEK